MHYTNGDRRILDRSRAKAIAYAAELPDQSQQTEYILQWAIAALLMGSALFTLFTMS
jgi:hypothetical protein